MASVEWTTEGLTSLARHDTWRIGQGWEPIALELYERVEAYFRHHNPDQPPGFLPGRPVNLTEEPGDLRMVSVVVRSKAFRVFFRYLKHRKTFEILRVLHPRAAYEGDKRQS